MRIQDLKNNDKSRDLVRKLVQAVHAQFIAATDFEHMLGKHVDNLDAVALQIATDHMYVTDHVIDRFFDLLVTPPVPVHEEGLYMLVFKDNRTMPQLYKHPMAVETNSFVRGLLQLDNAAYVRYFEWTGKGWAEECDIDMSMVAREDG